MAGYSGTPLGRRLGISAGHQVVCPRAPRDVATTLGALPRGVRVKQVARGPLDLIVAFCPGRSTLIGDTWSGLKFVRRTADH